MPKIIRILIKDHVEDKKQDILYISYRKYIKTLKGIFLHAQISNIFRS